jgi:hypothetical protein
LKSGVDARILGGAAVTLKEVPVALRGRILTLLLNVVRGTEVPLSKRVAVQARGINLAVGHACSPQG